jgi:glycosyltransferase involved in cell wall biosynthesis
VVDDYLVDLLIPTYRRPAALAVTLASLCAQSFRGFRIIVSDQTETEDASASREVQAALRVLQLHGHRICLHKHLPRRGLAEQRQFLLDQVAAPYALFLDDDVILEPPVIDNMLTTICTQGCGLVGCAVIGPSYANDYRPHEQAIEFWEGVVTPELIVPNGPKWDRHRLHNAANLLHVEQALGLSIDQPRCYRIAWVGGCVLFDTGCLRNVGGFSFWNALPVEHCGEDVLVQLRVMARHGGCGLIPSGVYHQELPTTVMDRSVDAPQVFAVLPDSHRKAKCRASTSCTP